MYMTFCSKYFLRAVLAYNTHVYLVSTIMDYLLFSNAAAADAPKGTIRPATTAPDVMSFPTAATVTAAATTTHNPKKQVVSMLTTLT